MSLGVISIISHFTRAIDSISTVQWTLCRANTLHTETFHTKIAHTEHSIQAKCYVNICVFVCFSFTFYFLSFSIPLSIGLVLVFSAKTSDIHFSCECTVHTHSIFTIYSISNFSWTEINASAHFICIYFCCICVYRYARMHTYQMRACEYSFFNDPRYSSMKCKLNISPSKEKNTRNNLNHWID